MRAAGLKNAPAGDDAHLKASDLKVVQALLGRSEAHPTKVLTGNEWLQRATRWRATTRRVTARGSSSACAWTRRRGST